MKQLDLDDLPPNAAKTLAEMADGEELVLVHGGVVVGRLISNPMPPVPSDGEADSLDVGRMKEVMEQFNAMIHDEF